jgi:hypothetical protein
MLLILPVTVLAAITWPSVRAEAYAPLSPALDSLWGAAREANLLSLDRGLLWGSFGSQSHLTGQLLQLTTPLIGDGAAGARAASLLLAVLALTAVWWAAGRVAGLAGSIIATTGLLLVDGFRDAALADPAAVSLVLTGALFVGALHRTLGNRDVASYSWLAAAAALAVLSEPLLFPGLAVVLLLVAALRMSPEHRMGALRAGVLVLVVLLVGNRLSVSHQADGDVFGDVAQRAAVAHSVESNLPSPSPGDSEGMTSYILGDHSPGVVVGGTLEGTYQAVASIAERRESRLMGLITLVMVLTGSAFILCVPVLRWLLIAPTAAAAPVLFLVNRGAEAAFNAAAFWLPALLVSAAVLLYALGRVLRPRSA